MLGGEASLDTMDATSGAASVLGAPGTAGDVQTAWMHLDVETTRALTGSLNRVFDTRPQTLLLAALARAWRDVSDGAPLRLDLEGHGRGWNGDGAVDLSHTVGWLTCLYPLCVHDHADRNDWEALISQVQHRLAAVPDGGLGFGVLSRLAPAGTLPDPHPREVCWNYLGASIDNTRAVLPGLRAQLAEESLPDGRLASDRVTHALDINAMVRDGKLAISFAHSSRTLDVRWTQALANRMEAALHALLAALQTRHADSAPSGAHALARNELDSLMLDITD
jgi:non-ribosomal peptide synthase protein (TIGR01720 family)